MSLRDDIRVAAEREGITASTKERRLYGLYGESWWDHEPMRNPDAIRAERERQEAARAKHARDLDEADRLMALLNAGGTIPDTYATPRREAAE